MQCLTIRRDPQSVEPESLFCNQRMVSSPEERPLRSLNNLFVACLAVMVVVPDGSALALLVFGLWGIYEAFKAGAHGVIAFWVADVRLRVLALAVVGFVLGNAFLLAYHGASSSDYEQLIPFILWPFASWLLVRQPVSSRLFFLGVAIAALSSGLFALIQVLWFDMPHESRASGWMANPIHFGHLCVLLAAYCLIGLLGSGGRVAGRNALLLGFCSALLGTILSGSKSSWLAFGVFLLYLGLVGLRAKQLSRALVVKAAVVIAVLFWAFIALSPSSQRLETFQTSVAALAAAVFDADKPLNLNEVSLDPSVNDRLAQYQMSAQLVAENPWFGISRPAINLEQEERVATAQPGFKRVYRHIHSEYLDTLVNRGLLGFLLLMFMFLALLWAVRRPLEPGPLSLGLPPSGPTKSLTLAPSQPRLLGTCTLLLLATMALFDILLSRVSVTALGLFVLAYCLATLYKPENAASALIPGKDS